MIKLIGAVLMLCALSACSKQPQTPEAPVVTKQMRPNWTLGVEYTEVCIDGVVYIQNLSTNNNFALSPKMSIGTSSATPCNRV